MAATLKGTIWGGVTISASPATVSIPSGSIYIKPDGTERFTVPNGIKVLYVEGFYVGVTPGSTHIWNLQTDYIEPHHVMEYEIYCRTHNKHNVAQWEKTASNEYDSYGATISWSSEINNHTPDSYDY